MMKTWYNPLYYPTGEVIHMPVFRKTMHVNAWYKMPQEDIDRLILSMLKPMQEFSFRVANFFFFLALLVIRI